MVNIIKAIIAFLIKIFSSEKKKPSPKNTPEYYKRKQFLTNAENSFFLTLKYILDDKYIIFAKPRMIDVIAANRYGKPKVIQKHIDFLITENNISLLAIELDDSSHRNRKEKDQAKNKIFESAEFPYLRIKHQKTYDTQKLKRLIQEKL